MSITKVEIEKMCKERFKGNIYKWAGTATLDKAIEQYKNFLVQKDLGTLPTSIMDYPIMGLQWEV